MTRRPIDEHLEGTAYSVPHHPDLDTLRDAGLWVDTDLTGKWKQYEHSNLRCPADAVKGNELPEDCEHCTQYNGCRNSTANRGGVVGALAFVVIVFLICAVIHALWGKP